MINDLLNQNTNSINTQKNSTTTLIHYGQVIDVVDDLDARRIKVFIPGIDNAIDVESIPFAMPLASLITCTPKVGESVIILLSDPTRPYFERFYFFGPVISQYQKIQNDEFATALSTSLRKQLTPLQAISTIPSANGNFPVNDIDKFDLALLGRGNTDIQQKDNLLIFRCGIYDTNTPIKSNDINPAYIMLRSKPDTENNTTMTSASIVADIINLMSHKGTRIAGVKLTDDDIQKIIDNGFSLLRGEPLIDYLQKFVNIFINHIHRGTHEVLADSDELKKLLDFNYDSLINKNIKIN